MTTTPETISLSEAVAIWLETDTWPHPIGAGNREVCTFTSDNGITWHWYKDQRFVKPVERSNCVESVGDLLHTYGNQVNHPQGLLFTFLAKRIDELEAKVK